MPVRSLRGDASVRTNANIRSARPHLRYFRSLPFLMLHELQRICHTHPSMPVWMGRCVYNGCRSYRVHSRGSLLCPAFLCVSGGCSPEAAKATGDPGAPSAHRGQLLRRRLSPIRTTQAAAQPPLCRRPPPPPVSARPFLRWAAIAGESFSPPPPSPPPRPLARSPGPPTLPAVTPSVPAMAAGGVDGAPPPALSFSRSQTHERPCHSAA